MGIENKFEEDSLENMDISIFEALKEADSHGYTPLIAERNEISYYQYEGGIREIGE